MYLARIAAGLLTAALLAPLAGCERSQPHAPASGPPAPASPPATAAPSPALEPSALSRSDLLGAMAATAAASAVGGAYPDVASRLAGRAFRISERFGCNGPSAPAASRGYTLNLASGAVRVWVRPEAWGRIDWARSLVAADDPEAIDGFWLRRPWIPDGACPAPGPAGLAAVPAPETMGVAQVRARGSSRLTRQGPRGYEVTRKSPSAAPAGRYQLVLEGRIADPADHRPVRCRAAGPDTPPLCLLLVEIQKVSLSDAAGEELGAWGQ